MTTNGNGEKPLNRKGNRRGNAANLIPFRKRDASGEPDPRMWHGGRPSKFHDFRAWLLDYLNEPTAANKTKLIKLIDDMAKSRNERKVLLEYAFGKVPDELKLTGGLELKLTQKKIRVDTTKL